MLTIQEGEAMRAKERADGTISSTGANAFKDLTDLQNDEFIVSSTVSLAQAVHSTFCQYVY